MTEDELVGWHHQLNDHESEQTLGDGDGQGGLCAAVHGHKETDATERLNNNRSYPKLSLLRCPTRRRKGNTLLMFRMIKHSLRQEDHPK